MEEQLALEEVIRPQYNLDLLVLQANELVRSQQDTLTLLEAKLIRLAIAQILKDSTDFRTYEIDIISLAKLLKIDKYSIYPEMDKLTTDLMRKIIYIKDKDSKKEKPNYLKLHWVDTARYKDGIITLKLSAELKPYLIGLNQLFTAYTLAETTVLPSVYSIRLFELLASYRNMRYRGIHNKTFNGIELEDNEIIFTIDYLRKFFDCENIYKDSNSNFITKVIKSSVNHINKKTIMRITFRTERDEHNYKQIKYVIFQFHDLWDKIEQ